MRKLYYLYLGPDGYELQEGEPGQTPKASTFFHLEQSEIVGEDRHKKQSFDQLLDAALRAEVLSGGREVKWMFNGVCLNTGMKHTGDFWEQYTEMHSEMNN